MQGRSSQCQPPVVWAYFTDLQGVRGSAFPTTNVSLYMEVPLVFYSFFDMASRNLTQWWIEDHEATYSPYWQAINPVSHSLYYERGRVLCMNGLTCCTISCYPIRCMQSYHSAWLRVNYCINHWETAPFSLKKTQWCPTRGKHVTCISGFCEPILHGSRFIPIVHMPYANIRLRPTWTCHAQLFF